MRNRHSQDSQRSQDAHPPAGVGERRSREERSRRADIGAAPGQDDGRDSDVEPDRDVQDEPPGSDEAPWVEPPREDAQRVRANRPGQSKRNVKQRGNNRKP